MAEQTITPLGKLIEKCQKQISDNEKNTTARSTYRVANTVLQGVINWATELKPDERALAEKMYKQGAFDYVGTAGVDKTMVPKTYEKWESELNADTKETFDKFYTQEPK